MARSKSLKGKRPVTVQLPMPRWGGKTIAKVEGAVTDGWLLGMTLYFTDGSTLEIRHHPDGLGFQFHVLTIDTWTQDDHSPGA